MLFTVINWSEKRETKTKDRNNKAKGNSFAFKGVIYRYDISVNLHIGSITCITIISALHVCFSVFSYVRHYLVEYRTLRRS